MTFLRSALRLAHRHQRIPYLPYVPTAGQGGVRKGFVAEFVYLTGWRYEEVCGLELAWVFLADLEIRLPVTKNGEGRVIALEGRLRELVEAWWARRRLACAHLFRKDGRRVKDALREQHAVRGR